MTDPNKPRMASALNCIVDDSALLAGLSDNTHDNLKQWVHDGAINLFVPLNTLDKLNSLRRSPPPVNLEARKTLEWLDDVTSVTAGKPAGRVELQGPDDQYQTWREVEKYLLPDTPLSSAMDNLDGIADEMRGRLSLRQSSRKGATALRDASESPSELSPESSPENAHATLAKENGASHIRKDSRGFSKSGRVPSGTGGIPSAVQPLLNYVVWRTYHGDTTIAGSGKYVLLTNDRITQRQAQKFGVRAKVLSQLNSIVSKNGAPKQNGNMDTAAESYFLVREIEPKEAIDEDPDEEIVFNPAQRPTSSRGRPTTAKVIDPDHFGRTNGAAPAATSDVAQTAKNGSPKSAFRGNGSRGPSGTVAGRGQNGSMRGRGQFHPRGGQVMRGNMPPVRGRFQTHQQPSVHPQSQPQNVKPIDPDSYTRPAPTMRGRGNTRRLWNPNT